MANAWTDYLATHIGPDGRHRDHPEWRPVDVWVFERSDGLVSAHKTESPFPTWRETAETSMRLADLHIPLGAPLPEGMRTRTDPDYGPLWGLADKPGEPVSMPAGRFVAVDGEALFVAEGGLVVVVRGDGTAEVHHG